MGYLMAHLKDTRLFSSLCCVLILTNGLHALSIKTNPKIVVIGSGPSGIACATSLLKFGFEDVTVLEAEPRIGGRIHTIPFADNVVDLGAQWCHGQDGNAVYEYVKDLDLLEPTGEVAKNFTLTRSNGETVPRDISQRLVAIIEGIRDNSEEAGNYEGSAHEFLNEQYKQILQRPENKDIDPEIAKEFLNQMEKDALTITGSDSLAVIPAHGNPDYDEIEGEYLLNWKDKGYKQFLNLLMKTNELSKEYGILDGRIKLLKTVETIHWQRDDGKVLIKLSDGEEILADHVIVTVSLGVLKAQHGTLFEPSLPKEKQLAIDGIDFGTVNKIFVEFSKRFWPDYFQGFPMLWREEDLAEIRGTDKAWYEGIFTFDGVSYQPRILQGWITGPEARHMETLKDEDIKEACMYIFNKFLTWEIPEPVNIIRTTWSTNPHFRGSYSTHTFKTEELGINRRQLANPLTKSIENCSAEKNQCEKLLVQFAGEATSSEHYSTVHGATETGWREARRLADFYGLRDV